MPPRSMVNQSLLLQKETTPGTPLVAAMKKVLGIKGTPGWEIESEDFKASGSKVNTARVINTEVASIDIEAVQDYNAIIWPMTGAFGAPVTTAVVGATGAYEHAFTLKAWESDPLVTFTGMWGDADRTVQLPYMYFNSFGLTVNRGGLSLTTGAMARRPELGVAMPTVGVTTVPSVPVASRSWDLFSDPTWAALGTTKLLAMYEGSLEFGDKYVPDYVVNSAQPSFSDVLEAEDTAYNGNLKIGFDATAAAYIADYQSGALRFLRFMSEGPVIEGTTKYRIEIDVCVRIDQPGKFESAPNSPARTLPFTFSLTVDPTTNNVAKARVINTVASL